MLLIGCSLLDLVTRVFSEIMEMTSSSSEISLSRLFLYGMCGGGGINYFCNLEFTLIDS